MVILNSLFSASCSNVCGIDISLGADMNDTKVPAYAFAKTRQAKHQTPANIRSETLVDMKQLPKNYYARFSYSHKE